MKRLLLLTALAAALTGCAVVSADDCWNDPQCRREWRQAEKDETAWLRTHKAHLYRADFARPGKHGKRGGEKLDKIEPRGALCGGLVTATGDRAQSIENAEVFALRSWQGQVMFKYGESYLNFHNAKHPKVLCSAASVADTVGGKIQQKFLGISHYRCELSAYPCRERPQAVTRDD